MANQDAQEKRPLESIIGELRHDYNEQIATGKKSKAPKAGKISRRRAGKKKISWPVLLATFFIFSGLVMAVYLFQLNQKQPGTASLGAGIVVNGGVLEDWEEHIDPTLPPESAIPLTEPEVAPIPTEPTLAPPEATPWPTPPIATPEP